MAITNIQYGSSIPASDVANILQQTDRQSNGVQTWRQLFGNAALGYQSNLGALEKDFSDAISQAYNSNLAQQGVISASGLAAGSRNYLQENLSKELSSVYETYVNNYRKAQQEAQQVYSDEYGIIAEELGTRAKNIATLYNESAYDFLSYLSEQDKLKDLNLNWLTSYNDKDNTYNLLSKDELLNKLFDSETGEINAYGREFFDAMFNFQGAEGINSFGRWLSETNPELAEWMLEQDVYDATGAMNLEKVKQIIGIGGDYDFNPSKYIETRNALKDTNFDLMSNSNYSKAKNRIFDKDSSGIYSGTDKYYQKTFEKLKTGNYSDARRAGIVRDYYNKVSNYLKESWNRFNELDIHLKNTLDEDAYKLIKEQLDFSFFNELGNLVSGSITDKTKDGHIEFLKKYSTVDKSGVLKMDKNASIEALNALENYVRSFETKFSNLLSKIPQVGEDYHKSLVEQNDKDRNK